ncbi:unnamed protein product, partial [Notodromas monacha]
MAALPPRKTSTPGRGTRRTLNSLEILLQMGFPRNRAEKALATTGDRGVQLASDWLLAHVNDVDLDAEVPREYVLYLCPKGALLESLQNFFRACFEECGWNRAMNQVPHITVCPFFPSPDEDLEKITEALQTVLRSAQPRFPPSIPLELYVSSNFIGLFLPRNITEFLRGIGCDYFKAVGQKRPLTLDDGREDLHLTLAYQFPSEVYPKLEKFARSIKFQVASDSWEFRLYSREARAIGRNCSGIRAHLDLMCLQVYRVLYSHVPIESDELELLLGDFVYVKSEDLNSSIDGWIQGTSWLTGCSGCLPSNYIERTAESDAWTLHKVFPMCRSPRFGSLDRLESRGRVSPSLCRRLSSHEHHDKPGVKIQLDSGPFCLPDVQLPIPNITPQQLPAPASPRHVIVVRHGERVDFTFGIWLPYVFRDGKYVRRDLNMPVCLPERPRLGPKGYAKDGPLTRVGLLQALSVGEAMREANVSVHHVYCSPAYRCIQTCDAILRGMGYRDAVQINVEPGLFEWLYWHEDCMPDCFTADELKNLGYNINLCYKPYVTTNELAGQKETCEEFYNRNFYITQSAANVTASQGKLTILFILSLMSSGGNILIVAHAASLDSCLRQLTGLAPRGPQDVSRIVHSIPYCAMSVVKEKCGDREDSPVDLKTEIKGSEHSEKSANKGQWRFVEPFAMQFTNSANMRYNWRLLLS